MQAPDYTHWHGDYELARNWYGEYVSELREVIGAGERSNPEARRLAAEPGDLRSRVLNDDNRKWSTGKEDPAAKAGRERRQEEFLKRYK